LCKYKELPDTPPTVLDPLELLTAETEKTLRKYSKYDFSNPHLKFLSYKDLPPTPLLDSPSSSEINLLIKNRDKDIIPKDMDLISIMDLELESDNDVKEFIETLVTDTLFIPIFVTRISLFCIKKYINKEFLLNLKTYFLMSLNFIKSYLFYINILLNLIIIYYLDVYSAINDEKLYFGNKNKNRKKLEILPTIPEDDEDFNNQFEVFENRLYSNKEVKLKKIIESFLNDKIKTPYPVFNEII
jgi:hypothetical protein